MGSGWWSENFGETYFSVLMVSKTYPPMAPTTTAMDKTIKFFCRKRRNSMMRWKIPLKILPIKVNNF